MSELHWNENNAGNELSTQYIDTFGMLPFGAEVPNLTANVVADVNDSSVRYYPPTNENGIPTGEITSAELELAEVQRNEGGGRQEEPKCFATLDEAIEFLGFGRFQIKIILLAGLAVAADAAEMLALSVLAPAVACEWNLSSSDQAALTMSVFAGMLLGAACWGKLSDKFGRRNCIVLFTICAVYAEVLCAVAPRFAWVVVFNVLVGFNVGGTPQTGTLLSEFLPARWRAVSLISLQLFWAIGGCFEALIALLVMQPFGWRALVLFNTIPLLIFLATSYWLPESVRYLLLSGRLNEAQSTLDRMARSNRKPCIDLMNVASVQEMLTSNTGRLKVDPNAEQRGRLRDLLRAPYRRITSALWPLWLLSAFSYYGIVLMTSTLFQLNDTCHGGTAGVPLSPTATAACRLDCVLLSTADYVRIVTTTAAEFPAIIFVLFVVDKWGRRNTLATCYVAFTIVVLLLNICMDRSWTTVSLFAARGFVTGAHETLHVYTPESYPTALRATGVGAAASFGRVGAMLTPLVAQLLAGADQLNAAFAIYATAGVLSAAASLLLPFETKDRQLTEHVNHVPSLDQQVSAASVNDANAVPDAQRDYENGIAAAASSENYVDHSGLQRRNVTASD